MMRISIALNCILAAVVVAGCLAPSTRVSNSPGSDNRQVGIDAGPKVTTSGPAGDVATVLAKFEEMNATVEGIHEFTAGLKTMITNTREQTIQATRDAVTRTGLGDWGLVAVVFILQAGSCIEARIGARRHACTNAQPSQ